MGVFSQHRTAKVTSKKILTCLDPDLSFQMVVVIHTQVSVHFHLHLKASAHTTRTLCLSGLTLRCHSVCFG